MAGHEHSAVRPKTTQDASRIAAGSPLAVQGIFLEVLRERFNKDSGLEWVWNVDPTLSTLLIETSFNEETEIRNAIPALYVLRQNTVPQKMMVGDRVGTRLEDHLEGFGAIVEMALSVDCVTVDEGTSALLGDAVQFTLLASQDVIQREFGLYEFTHPVLGPTQPYPKDQEKWLTSVTFTVQFWIRWSQVIIAPLVQQIATRIKANGTDASSYFRDVTLTSMQRQNSE